MATMSLKKVQNAAKKSGCSVTSVGVSRYAVIRESDSVILAEYDAKYRDLSPEATTSTLMARDIGRFMSNLK